jgi:hypothetical protein
MVSEPCPSIAETTYLGSPAVSDGANTLRAVLAFQMLDSGLHHRVLRLGRVLRLPRVKVEALGAVQRQRIAVEGVDNNRRVPIGGELVRDELAVLPDADDVGDDQNGDVLVRLVRRWRGEVCIDLAVDLDGFSMALATASPLAQDPRQRGETASRSTYSWRTPMVQHCAGGCDAMSNGMSWFWVERSQSLSTSTAVWTWQRRGMMRELLEGRRTAVAGFVCSAR